VNKKVKKSDLHRFRLAVAGFFRCVGLLVRNRKTHYVLSTFGIGDAIMACAYLRAYKEAYKIPHVTLVGKKSMSDIFMLYKNEYDELLLLEDKKIVQLTDAFLFDFAYYWFYRWKFQITPAVIICHIKNFNILNYNGNAFFNSSRMYDLYKSVLYMLPQGASMVLPDVRFLPDIRDEIYGQDVVKGRSVILLPFANSVQTIDMAFWNALAARLTDNGYVCFTNANRPGDKPITGTKAISFGIAQTAAFIQYCGRAVSLRNGMCDLIQYTNCKLAVVYSETENGGTKHFYGLGGQGEIAEIKEFTPLSDNYAISIDDICEFLGEVNE
jgi:hypothetical protein